MHKSTNVILRKILARRKYQEFMTDERNKMPKEAPKLNKDPHQNFKED